MFPSHDTDTCGDANDNLKLSTERSKAVYDYLIQTEQIDATRLTYKGYGETLPIISDKDISNLAADNEKEKAHQKKRRTVYKIL